MSQNCYKTLNDFLKTCVVQKGEDFTHTTMYEPKSSYYITPDKTDKFYELYKKCVSSDADLYLTEKHRDIGPFVIDINFHFDCIDDTQLVRKYTEKDIINIVNIYSKAIKDYICGTSSFTLYVLEKPLPVTKNSLVRDGIHIVIPDIITRPIFQLMLREKVVSDLDKNLKHLDCSNNISNIVNEEVIHIRNWQMLGSKKPHMDKYMVTHIYEYNVNDESIKEMNVSTEQSDYVELLSIRNKYLETDIRIEKQEEIKVYEELISNRKKLNHQRSYIPSNTIKQVNTNQELELAKSLVELLNSVRAENYHEWIRVGWCLRNIDKRLLQTWVKFSKKSKKFVYGACERTWNNMRHDKDCLGIGTLHFWAKQDSPDRYLQLHR